MYKPYAHAGILGHFINGQHVTGQSGRVTEVFNPAFGTVARQVALATVNEVGMAIAAAAQAIADTKTRFNASAAPLAAALAANPVA